MTDEHKQTDEQQPVVPAAPGAAAAPEVPAVETPAVVDPWAQAFDALAEQAAPADAGAEVPADAGQGGEAGTGAAEGAATGDAVQPGDAGVGTGDAGGSVPGAGGAGEADAGEPPVDVEARITELTGEVEQRALADTAKLFLDKADEQGRKLIRQTNGVLGATIKDPDIYQVINGVPTFVNPDTGQPFTGDNPRAQAQEWCDLYNRELRETFNTLATQRQGEIETEIAPQINLLKFMPTYNGLDPVRQKLFDAIVADYEVYDGEKNHVGYSVDLNQVLAQVNRQVAALQNGRQSAGEPAGAPQAPAAEQPAAPTGPALDMPTSGSSATSGAKAPASVAEALEQMENAKLDKLSQN